MQHSIKTAEHAGFCFGVQRAVDAAYEELRQSAQDGVFLYCLGQLIHNKAVMEKLQGQRLVTIQSIEEAPPGSRVLIRAHGEPPETYRKAEEKGIRLIDATCPYVARIHEEARNASSQGRCVFVIGDPAHPEVIGILGCADTAVGAADTPAGVRTFSDLLAGKAVTALAQTTITRETFNACCEVLRELCSDLHVEDTICNASKLRQEAAERLAQESDAMVVIGDFGSSNSKKLYDICAKKCRFTVFVEKAGDLPLQELEKCCKIGVAASASAPKQIILEVIANMSEVLTNDQNTELYNEMVALMGEIDTKLPGRGEVITGTVVQVTNDYVVVNLGCKKDGMLPKEEVTLEDGQALKDAFKEGDEVQAKVIKTDDGDGNILLSKKKLQSGENWEEINAALDSKEVVNVTVLKEVKGGVIAAYKEVSGFIPMSQLADHYVENADEFIGKTLPVKVTRVDQRRNKAVFSHKAFLTEEKHKKIAEIWETLNVGDVVEGKVMRFTDYGAFVDIGGIDGLLHISEISWGKLRHPQEALQIGQVINVKILSMNPEKGKISLGLKQNAPEPWSVIDENYQEGDVVRGKVAQIKEYGAFVELAPGLDGLVHISEVAHKRVAKISDELQIGQEIDAKILEIDKEKRRISLSIKATLPAPGSDDEPKAAAEEEAPAQEVSAEETQLNDAPAEEA